jgi:cytidyltransferase-like protein
LAVLGGTFDHLHVGHHALLATSFRVGRTVGIGVTTDRFVSDHPKPIPERIQPFSTRRAALARWVRRTFPGRRWWVIPLDTVLGRSLDPEVRALIVSPETAAGGRAVNRERRRRKRRPVLLVVVPLALADDLEPVSSRRIRAGEIAPDGRRRSAIRVALTTDEPTDRAPAARAIRRVFPKAEVTDTGARRAGSAELLVRVARRPAGGWVVAERSPRIRLPPRVLPGRRAIDLERGLVAVLRPRL